MFPRNVTSKLALQEFLPKKIQGRPFPSLSNHPVNDQCFICTQRELQVHLCHLCLYCWPNKGEEIAPCPLSHPQKDARVALPTDVFDACNELLRPYLDETLAKQIKELVFGWVDMRKLIYDMFESGNPLYQVALNAVSIRVQNIEEENSMQGLQVPVYTHADAEFIACELQFFVAYWLVAPEKPNRPKLKPTILNREVFRICLNEVYKAVIPNRHEDETTPDLLYDTYLLVARNKINDSMRLGREQKDFFMRAVEHLIKRLWIFGLFYQVLREKKDKVLNDLEFQVHFLKQQLRRHYVCRKLLDPNTLKSNSQETLKRAMAVL